MRSAPNREDESRIFDDQTLAARVAAGDTALFARVVERHQSAVHAMGMSFFRNREDAADFTQEVFLKAYRNLASFEGRSRFSTWLYRIAYNTAINNINRSKDYLSLADEEKLPDGDTPERQLLLKTSREAVREAVRDLPEKYRVCVDLFFFYDRSYQEIEAITGFPVNTIKSHVFRAKKILRDALIDFGIEERR